MLTSHKESLYVIRIIYPFWWLACFVLSKLDSGLTPSPRWAWARNILLGERFPKVQ